MDDRRLYETILGLVEPWYVAEVKVRVEAEEIRVHVEWREGAALVCPDCGQPAQAMTGLRNGAGNTWTRASFARC